MKLTASSSPSGLKLRLVPPDSLLDRCGQAGQLAAVIQPEHDRVERAFNDRVPLLGGISAQCGGIDIGVLPAHPEVSQSHGRDGMVADFRQPVTTLAVGAENLRGPLEPVQAVEPLAARPRTLQRRPLGDQRIAQRQPGLALGVLGPGEACPVVPRRQGRDDRDDNR